MSSARHVTGWARRGVGAAIAVAILGAPGQARSQARSDDYAGWLAKGAKAAKARTYPKALEAFVEAVKADPAQLDGYFNAANVALHLKRCREVLLYFSGFLYLTPGTPDDKEAKAGLASCSTSTGTLSVKSDPPGLEAYLDGAVVGKTPVAEARLAPGTYHLEIRHPDYQPASEELTLAENEKKEVAKALQKKPAYGFVDVKPTPPDGVRVFVDDREVGVTPMEKLKLENRKVLFKFVKPGYETFVRSVVVPKDKTATLSVTLEKAAPAPLPAGR